MAKQTKPQKKTVKRIMHEYKHGELESSSGRKVKSRKQAVAIALSEAGASKFQSPQENRRRLSKTKAKEARGQTRRARYEGRGRGPSKSTRSTTAATGKTKAELYKEAVRRDIPGRSKMSKGQLAKAVGTRR